MPRIGRPELLPPIQAGGAMRSAHRLTRLFYVDTDTIQIIPRGDVDLVFFDGSDRYRWTFAEGTSQTVNLSDVQISGATGATASRTYHFFLGYNTASGFVTGHFLDHGSFASSSLFDAGKLQPIAGQVDAAFAGYLWLYCGSLVLNSSAQFRLFEQVGDRIYYPEETILNGAFSTSSSNQINASIPLGLRHFVWGNLQLNGVPGGSNTFVSSRDGNNSAYNVASTTSATNTAFQCQFVSNNNSQLNVYANNANSGVLRINSYQPIL